jgi:CRISPR-associated protein Csx10
LGALGFAHQSFYKDKQEELAQFFLRENVYYSYLYPASFADEEATTADDLPVYPAPKTAVSCKRHPGFVSRRDPDQHGIRDSLLDWAVFKLSNEKDLHRLVQYQDCPRCQSLMEALPEKYRRPSPMEALPEKYRYYRRLPYAPDHRVSAKLKTRLQTRTGINRDWDIVENSVLYHREVIEEGTRFWGTVRLPADLAEDFKRFVIEVNDAQLIHLGTGRTRGLGHVNIRIEEHVEEETGRSTFDERLQVFNDAVHTLLGTQQHKALFYFAITLHSPVILRDHWLRYCNTLSKETLAELVKLENATFQEIYQNTSMMRVIGWNGTWNTPRVQEYAIDTGSVFLFSSQNAEQGLLDALFRLEQEGIGLRRAEGFGRICISDTFHMEGDYK